MFLSSIELENVLSFGITRLELQPLNVLIGANATGKSNFIRAAYLLGAFPSGALGEFSMAGARAWVNWRTNGPARIAVKGEYGGTVPQFKYDITFRAWKESYEIVSENLAEIFRRDTTSFELRSSEAVNDILPSQSVLSQVRHPSEPEIGRLSDMFKRIRLYREFRTGPNTQARYGISSNVLGAYLLEDGANLALVLGELDQQGLLDRINKSVAKLFDLFERVSVLTRNGITQVYIHEKGLPTPFAAASLSDGTLRFLCLLAVLLDPTPPPLVCIDEPEAGLHPDAIRMVAELLVEASERTQLIVTTHSPALVDALSAQPESVIVCERDFDGFTQFRRLKREQLDTWLEDYSLGDLWQKGEIGGNRW